MATIGPKEQQIRDLPARQKPASTKTAPAKPAAVATPKPAEPAQQETTTMKTGAGKAKSKKGTHKAKKAAKAPTTTRRQKGSPAASPARQAAPKTQDGVRPGSKLEAIVGLLRRPEGCTTAQVLKATEWPSVSMPQQAKAAGITLHKEKVEGVTVYRDAAMVKKAT